MWEVSEHLVVGASPEKVWGVVTDVARHPELAGSGEIHALRVTEKVGLGSVWEADIDVRGLGTFVSRSKVLEFSEGSAFSWTSEPPPIVEGEPRSAPGIRWWFRLHPGENGGTAIEHSVVITTPEVGAEEMTEFFEQTDRVGSIRAGMRATLENLKAAVVDPD